MPGEMVKQPMQKSEDAATKALASLTRAAMDCKEAAEALEASGIPRTALIQQRFRRAEAECKLNKDDILLAMAEWRGSE